MDKNIGNPFNLRFVPLLVAADTVVGGAVGWIDTDLSAKIPAGLRNKTFVIACLVAGVLANQFAGVRAHGEAIDNKVAIGNSAPFISMCSSAGHFDYYRDAADHYYTVLGYLDG